MSLRGINRINNRLSSNLSACEPRVMLSASLPEASQGSALTGTVSDSDVVSAVQPGLTGQIAVPSLVEKIDPSKSNIDYAANQGIQSISEGLLSGDSDRIKQGQGSLTFARRLAERAGASSIELAQFDYFVLSSVRSLVDQGSSQSLDNAVVKDEPAPAPAPAPAAPSTESVPVTVKQAAADDSSEGTTTENATENTGSANRISTRLFFDENGNAVLVVNEATGDSTVDVNVSRS